MLTQVIVPILSALLGGSIVAILNFFLNRKKMEADIEKIKAETEKIRLETTYMGRDVDVVKSGQKKQEDKIVEIQRFLVRHFITEDERRHLERLATKEYWPFTKDDTTDFFLKELRNLRSMNLIEGHPKKGIRSLFEEGGDINNHFKIRPEGKEYLKLLHESNNDYDDFE